MSSVRAGVSGARRGGRAGGATRLLFARRRRRRVKSLASAVKVAEHRTPPPHTKTLSLLPVPTNVPADSEEAAEGRDSGG